MAKQENPDWVRVKDTRTGHEITVSRRVVNDKHPHYEVLDKPAVDRSGRPLAAKPKRNLEPLANGETKATEAEDDSNMPTPPPAAPAAEGTTKKGGSR